MVMVDTSVWVSHFRQKNDGLESLLMEGNVVCHPFIIGELACGNLRNRAEILGLLGFLPQAKTARHEEVMSFIEKHDLAGKGIGYIDAHLCASALLSGIPVWTYDKKLAEVSRSLGINY